MLVLSRRVDESIMVGDEIEIVVLEIRGNRVRLGFKGPAEIPIVRSELLHIAEAVTAPLMNEQVCTH